MRKILSCIIITTIIGAVIVICIITSGETEEESNVDLISNPSTTYIDLRDSINIMWRNQDWSVQIYTNRKNAISISVKNDFLTSEEGNVLEGQLVTLTLNSLLNKIKGEFCLSACDIRKVEKNKAGIDYLVDQGYVQNSDKRVALVRDCYNTYLKIFSFVNTDYSGKEPNFHVLNQVCFWNEFYDSPELVRNSYYTNSIYKTYLSNIKDLNDGLNQIVTKYEAGKKAYSESIFAKCRSYYDSERSKIKQSPAIDSQKKEQIRNLKGNLYQTYKNFKKQFNNNNKFFNYYNDY